MKGDVLSPVVDDGDGLRGRYGDWHGSQCRLLAAADGQVAFSRLSGEVDAAIDRCPMDWEAQFGTLAVDSSSEATGQWV